MVAGAMPGSPFRALEKVVDGVLIALVAVGACFDNGNGTNSSPELVYFDQVSKEVAANFCIDQARLFIAGYSSGSWLSHLIGCARAEPAPGKVRGQVTATGEWPNPPPCTGPIASMLAHDMADDQNPFAAGMVARDHILKANQVRHRHCPLQLRRRHAGDRNVGWLRRGDAGMPALRGVSRLHARLSDDLVPDQRQHPASQ